MYSHILTQQLTTPQGVLTDLGNTYSADSVTAVQTVVNANGGGANAVAVDFTAASFVALALLSTVPCVVTLTGADEIDGIATSTVTLQANALRHVTDISGNVTAVSVGANTTVDGAAGTLEVSLLFNS
jgi:hypothetical protein